MNAKKFSEAMNELDNRYMHEALSYQRNNPSKKFGISKRMTIWIAAAITLLALCGFAVYELSLNDPWQHKPSMDPIKTVQSALEEQAGKEYTIALRIDQIEIDEAETERVRAMYTGSELAESRGWTDEYLAEHFIVIEAKYYAEYDHTKTFLDDGYIEHYFYLAQDTKTGQWTIVDHTTPSSSSR